MKAWHATTQWLQLSMSMSVPFPIPIVVAISMPFGLALGAIEEFKGVLVGHHIGGRCDEPILAGGAGQAVHTAIVRHRGAGAIRCEMHGGGGVQQGGDALVVAA